MTKKCKEKENVLKQEKGEDLHWEQSKTKVQF